MTRFKYEFDLILIMAIGGIGRPSYFSSSSSNTRLLEKPIFQYVIVLAIIATLIVSIFALINTSKLSKKACFLKIKRIIDEKLKINGNI